MSNQSKDQDYQHRVVIREKDRPDYELCSPTNNPKQAGEIFKNFKSNIPPNGSIAIQRRPLGQWEDIERINGKEE
jgi:hypothetical protein